MKQRIFTGLRYLAGAVFLVFVYRCPFRLIFGVACPGCGLTRAMLCLLKLDIVGAFSYHPLFWLVVLWGIYLLCVRRNWKFSACTELALLCISVILFFGVYIFRLTTGTLV